MIKKRIREILKNGEKIETELFILYFKKREDLKIGFLISSKIGGSVKRNKIKRIIREIVRKYLKKGDYLFVLKKNITEKGIDEIKKNFRKVFKEIYYSSH
jgi:ribonuclease P protein component